MFIRQYNNSNPKSGKNYKSFAIVSSERCNDKIVQKNLLNLGSDFNLPKEKWPMLILKIKKYLQGSNSLLEETFNTEYEILAKKLADQIIEKKNKDLEKITNSTHSDIIKVDRRGVDGEDYRSAGPEHVALHGAERLNLLNALTSLGLPEAKAKLALALVAARMVHPGSERETYRYLACDSTLAELLGIEINSESSLYRIIDKLYENKSKIENSLIKNINSLFKTNSIVTFYDLTNTYFEGASKADKLKRGHSKEKRSDCPLVTLAVVLDANGFVIRSEVFSGNVSEPGTLEGMLGKLKATDAGKVVMDRGIATASNIKWLNEGGYSYLVVNKEQKRIFDDDKAILIKDNSISKVYGYKEISSDGTEARLYCHSMGRENKENAICEKKSKEFEEQLNKINNIITNNRYKRSKIDIERRVGRLLEKYTGISQHYAIKVFDNSESLTDNSPVLATKIVWEKNPVVGSMMEKPGVYCLKTNDLSMSANEMMDLYTKLTDIESVFRSLKSELGLRPVYHQKETRIESHLFITILAYQCVQVVRAILKSSGINDSWWSIRNCLSTHGRISYILPDSEGGFEVIRKALRPKASQAAIYRALRITSRPGGIYNQKIKSKITKI
jgi:hypothetical protein